jgi:hypothetical protein
MVAYSFKKHFRVPILAGAKRQTIRSPRKRHALPGEQVQLYTGMRTRHCQIIGRALCAEVRLIRIGVEERWIEFSEIARITSRGALDQFAISDGFTGWEEMQAFWRANHPDTPVFSGVLIRWDGLRS